MIKVYGIKNCDSVKKTLRFLQTHNLPYTFIDFRETPVEASQINNWLDHTDVNTLFNTRGTTYRILKLKELDLDDTDKKRWLAEENMLIKRPVITLENDVIVGYNEELFRQKLL